MVGVPGRSKACNTCRQRKVSCSLEKPECRTCLKSSRVCTGYQRERIFLLDQRTEGKGPKCYRKPVNHTAAVVTEHKRKTIPLKKQFEKTVHPIIPEEITPVARILTPSLRSVYREQILSDLVELSIPDSYQIIENQRASESQPGSWFAMLPSLPDMTSALETALFAISIAKLGRIKQDPGLIHESLKFYTGGLIELQKALWSPRLMYRDETVAASMALVLYEAMECPERSIAGWRNHMHGCVKLFELKGPKAFNSIFGHQVFLSFRLMEIQLALTERRPTFLADPVWIDRPWANFDKTSFHKFLDILVALPNTIADGYRLLEPLVLGKEVDHEAILLGIVELLKRCWKLDEEFKAFYTDLETTYLGPLYWPNLSGVSEPDVDDSTQGKIFPVSFHFPNFQMAHLCALYWTASCILWSGMRYSYTLLASFQIDPSLFQLPLLEHRVDVASCARNICQSLEYFTREEHRVLGMTALVFPLKVAIETFNDAQGCERELAWALAAMTKIGDGVQIMNHLGVKMTDHAYLPG